MDISCVLPARKEIAIVAGEGSCFKREEQVANCSRPSFKKDTLTENKDVQSWIEKYLGVGEWVMDQSVAIAGSSSYFERKR